MCNVFALNRNSKDVNPIRIRVRQGSHEDHLGMVIFTSVFVFVWKIVLRYG